MYNFPEKVADLYLQAIEIMKKLENERTAYEKRILEVIKKYSYGSNSFFVFNEKIRKVEKED